MSDPNLYHVVAMFESEREAKSVVEDLVANGFQRDHVRLMAGDLTGNVASGGSQLSGSASSTQHSGGILGWFENLFGGDDRETYSNDRDTYTKAVERGNCVVAVDATGDSRDRAVDVMKNHNAIDIDKHQHSAYDSDDDRENVAEGAPRGVDRQASIPVVQEELQVGKRAVQGGGVRVYSRTVEQPVEQQVNLREERVRVERRPVNRELTEADAAALQDREVEVVETTEEPVIRKSARVVEEVVVGKDVNQRTETVRDTVRRTDVQTEQISSSKTRAGKNSTKDAGSYEDDFRRNYETQYGAAGGSYADYAPAYDYGYRMGSDTRYRGKAWGDVEDTLKTDFLRNNPNSSWDRAKGAVRYGWEKMTGQR